MQQVEPHHGIADVQQGLIDRIVGGSTRKRLHVDVDLVGGKSIRGERLGGAAAGERFDRIRVFHAFVVARVTVAAVFCQPHGVVENFLFAHPT